MYASYRGTHARRHKHTPTVDMSVIVMILILTLTNHFNSKERNILKMKNPNKIVKVFGGRFVKGSFIKKDGSTRSFHGQLIPNTRSNKALCFKDLRKNCVIRSISIASGHIRIQSGALTFETGGAS